MANQELSTSFLKGKPKVSELSEFLKQKPEFTLNKFLNENFGMKVVGAKKIEVPKSPIETVSYLHDKEQQLVENIEQNGIAAYRLDSKEGMEFTMALGPCSMVKLAFPNNQQAFATTTPDTSFDSGQLRFAFLGRISDKSLIIPDNLDPLSNRVNKQDVVTYLSGANQLSTVGEHDPTQQIEIVDPRHLLNAMAEFNIGSKATKIIESTKPSERDHIGDTWERNNRSMLPIISAQDVVNNPQNDLVWSPITFTPLFSVKEPEKVRFVVVLTPDMLDKQALAKRKLVPIKTDKPDALKSLQEMGFATLLEKGNAVDNLARKVEKGMI